MFNSTTAQSDPSSVQLRMEEETLNRNSSVMRLHKKCCLLNGIPSENTPSGRELCRWQASARSCLAELRKEDSD